MGQSTYEPKQGSNVVVIGDRHDLVCAGLRHTASNMGSKLEFIDAGSFGEVLEELERNSSARLCLLDRELPDMRGLESVRDVHERRPDVLVAVMSELVFGPDAMAAMEAGAVGFVPKTMRAEAIVNALRLMLSGECFLPAAAVGDRWASRDDLAELTARERDILHGIAQGLPNKAIAHDLGIKEVTVRVHASNLYRKLGVITRTQAALYAQKLWGNVKPLHSRHDTKDEEGKEVPHPRAA